MADSSAFVRGDAIGRGWALAHEDPVRSLLFRTCINTQHAGPRNFSACRVCHRIFVNSSCKRCENGSSNSSWWLRAARRRWSSELSSIFFGDRRFVYPSRVISTPKFNGGHLMPQSTCETLSQVRRQHVDVCSLEAESENGSNSLSEIRDARPAAPVLRRRGRPPSIRVAVSIPQPTISSKAKRAILQSPQDKVLDPSDLDADQRRAVSSPPGPLIVLGGPGSGKTRVAVHRIQSLIENYSASPSSVSALCFSNRAAREIRRMLSDILGEDKASRMFFGTCSSVALTVLRRNIHLLGYKSNFVLYDAEEQQRCLRKAMRVCRLDPERYRPSAVLEVISRAKAMLMEPASFVSFVQDKVKSPEPHWSKTAEVMAAARVYSTYQQLLLDSNAVDTDDLVLLAVRLMRENEDVVSECQSSWRHVIVDDLQNMNPAEYELVRLICSQHASLSLFGDPLQTVSLRWPASGSIVDRVHEDFPEATVVNFDCNYRSTAPIVAAGQFVLYGSPGSTTAAELNTTKSVRTGEHKVICHQSLSEKEEARFVVEEIQRLLESGAIGTLGDVAVMYRSHSQSRLYEDEFVRAQLPYVLIGSTKFYQRKEVKDLIAYLRLVHNPFDSAALERTINVPPRGIGDRSWSTLQEWTSDLGYRNVYSALAEFLPDGLPATLSTRVGVAVTGFSVMIDKLRQFAAGFIRQYGDHCITEKRHQPTVQQLLDAVLEGINYRKYIMNQSDGEQRWQYIEELRALAAEYTLDDPLAPAEVGEESMWTDAAGAHVGDGQGESIMAPPAAQEYVRPLHKGLAEFLQDLSMLSDADALDDGDRSTTLTRRYRLHATLMPVEAAHALEFPIVFMVACEEGLMPAATALDDDVLMDQERRLAYMGITRAMDRLYVCFSNKRRLQGSYRASTTMSRFVQFPQEIVQLSAAQVLRDQEMARQKQEKEEQRRQQKRNTRPPWGGSSNGFRFGGFNMYNDSYSQQVDPAELIFKCGERVAHSMWGTGTVVESSPHGYNDEIVEVQFDDHGFKRVLGVISGLEKLDKGAEDTAVVRQGAESDNESGESDLSLDEDIGVDDEDDLVDRHDL